MRRLSYALFGLIFSALAGCGVTTAQRNAEDVADLHFQGIQKGNWNYVLAQYDPTFFFATSAPQWKATLVEMQHRLGNYQSRALTAAARQTYAGVAGTEERTMLTYKVRYTNGEIQETFGFVDRTGEGSPQIVTHSFRSANNPREQATGG